jgi:serine/threonine protein kinase
MGKVYLAVHPGLGRTAAVKVLGAREVDDSEAVGRFLTEARAANAIRHENIVDIYDSGTVENGMIRPREPSETSRRSSTSTSSSRSSSARTACIASAH